MEEAVPESPANAAGNSAPLIPRPLVAGQVPASAAAQSSTIPRTLLETPPHVPSSPPVRSAEDLKEGEQAVYALMASFKPLSKLRSVYDEALIPAPGTPVPPARTKFMPALGRHGLRHEPARAATVVGRPLAEALGANAADGAPAYSCLEAAAKTLRDARWSLVEANAAVEGLEHRINRAQEYEAQARQIKPLPELTDYTSRAADLAVLTRRVQEVVQHVTSIYALQVRQGALKEIPNYVSSELDRLVQLRDAERMAAAKSLDRLLRTIGKAEGVREKRLAELVAFEASSTIPAVPTDKAGEQNQTYDEAAAVYSQWQREVLQVFGHRIRETNRLMKELSDSINAEAELYRQHQELASRGSRLAAQMVASRFDGRCEAIAELKQQLSNITAIRRRLDVSALELKATPSPEAILELRLQVDDAREKLVQTKAKLKEIRQRALNTSSPDKASGDSTGRQEMATLRRQIVALADRERQIAQLLKELAQRQYPELKAWALDYCNNVDSSSDNVGETPRQPPFLATQSLAAVGAGTSSLQVKTTRYSRMIKKYDAIISEQKLYFKRAANELCRCDHPNLAQFSSFWIDNDVAFVDMPFYEGRTFREWSRERIQTTTTTQAREIFEAILSGIAYLHERGIVHGALSLDCVIIVDRASAEGVGRPSPVVCGYNFHRIRKAANDHGVPGTVEGVVATASQDVWDYGFMLCEVLNVSRDPPDIDENGNVVIPKKLVSRLNSRHLQEFLAYCLSKEVETRPTASTSLLHPYFTCKSEGVAFSTTTDDLFAFETDVSAIKAAYEQMFAERTKYKGALIQESQSDNDAIEQTMDTFSTLDVRDFWKPLVIACSRNDGDRTAIIEPGQILTRLILRSGMFRSEQSEGTLLSGASCLQRTYLPDPEYPHLAHFTIFGRLLCKCIIDGRKIPCILDASLFKWLLGVKPDISDFDVYSPEKSLEVRLQAACTPGMSMQELHEKAETVLVGERRWQLNAIREGFLQCAASWFRPQSVSAFDLALICHQQYAKHTLHWANPERARQAFRQCITLSGFPPESATPEHFWRWLDSLETRGRCLFLWFATGRCGLPPGAEPKQGGDRNDVPLDRQPETATAGSAVTASTPTDDEAPVSAEPTPATAPPSEEIPRDACVVVYCVPLGRRRPVDRSSSNVSSRLDGRVTSAPASTPAMPTNCSDPHDTCADPSKVPTEQGLASSQEGISRPRLSRSKTLRSQGPASATGDESPVEQADQRDHLPVQRVFCGQIELPDYRNFRVLTMQMAAALQAWSAKSSN